MTIEKNEYGSFYEGYIRYSNGKDLFDLLEMNENEMVLLIGTLTEDQTEYSYTDGKWSIKDVIMFDCGINFMLKYEVWEL